MIKRLFRDQFPQYVPVAMHSDHQLKIMFKSTFSIFLRSTKQITFFVKRKKFKKIYSKSKNYLQIFAGLLKRALYTDC